MGVKIGYLNNLFKNLVILFFNLKNKGLLSKLCLRLITLIGTYLLLTSFLLELNLMETLVGFILILRVLNDL